MAKIGDARVAARLAWAVESIAACGSLVLREVGGDRAGEVALQRLLASPALSVEAITATLGARTAQACAGRHVLAVQDTTEVNFAGRSRRRSGLGPAGNGRDLGFFIHPVLAVDVESQAVLGLVDAQIWTRPHPRSEAERWLRAGQTTAAVLAEAARVTLVADRESDIYALFAQRPPTLDLIVRAAQDRALAGGGRLFEALADAPERARRTVRVPPRRPGDPGREAVVAIRAGRVEIARPQGRGRTGPALPEGVELTLVEAIEVAPPAGAQPIGWRLLTTHAAQDPEAVVDLYRLRWRIEQVFRALKSDGLDLESTQVQGAERLFLLGLIGLAGAVRTLQMMDAREGGERPLSDALDPALAEPLQVISKSLERGTAIQRNPHPPDRLASLTWVCARLGGWNCYGKKPGPKTIHRGWTRLAPMLAGYLLAQQTKLA